MLEDNKMLETYWQSITLVESSLLAPSQQWQVVKPTKAAS